MSPELRERLKSLPRPARQVTKDAILALAPERRAELAARVYEGLTEVEAQRWLAEIREARRPKMPTVPIGAAERGHRQSGERLVRLQAELAERESIRLAAREAERALAERAAKDAAYQRAVEFWVEQRLFAEEAEARFRRSDPCCLYHSVPCHRGD
jgi:hypothetical protein